MKLSKLKKKLKNNFNLESSDWLREVDERETAKELLYLFQDYGYTFEEAIDKLLLFLIEE